MNRFSSFWQMVRGLRKRWLGLIVGFMLWVCWMWFGLWATVAMLILCGIGYVVGRVLEEHQSWKDVVDKLLSERFSDT